MVLGHGVSTRGFEVSGRVYRSPETTLAQLPESASASQQQGMSQQLHDRIVKLCAAIIADKHADQLVKEEAMLLRCDVNEVDESDD